MGRWVGSHQFPSHLQHIHGHEEGSSEVGRWTRLEHQNEVIERKLDFGTQKLRSAFFFFLFLWLHSRGSWCCVTGAGKQLIDWEDNGPYYLQLFSFLLTSNTAHSLLPGAPVSVFKAHLERCGDAPHWWARSQIAQAMRTFHRAVLCGWALSRSTTEPH